MLRCTFFFSAEKLVLLSLLQEVKPSPYRKMIKLLTFDNLFPPLRHLLINLFLLILAHTSSKTTTAITFSRQNDAGSRASAT